ncbi:MAG: glycosyltransferase family 39 protein, partial [Gammaproteobacteria bacterium]
PGAPFIALMQYLSFSLFGASIETARMTSVVFSLISGLAIYSIARSSLSSWVSLLIAVAGLLTISFLGHARAAIPDPVATSMALLGLLVFIRVRSRNIAIPLSIFFAFLAFFSKMYFLSALLSIIFLWGVELFILPMIYKYRFDRDAIVIFVLSLFLLASSYLLYFYIFRFEITIFQSINKNKIPYLDAYFLYLEIKQSLSVFALNTKTNVLLFALAATYIYFIFTAIRAKAFAEIFEKLRKIGRAEYALATWLSSGILLIGILQAHKAHYHFFAILPLIFFAVVSLKLVLPERFYGLGMSLLLFAHLAYQVPYYIEWQQRPDKTVIYDASKDIAGRVLEGETARVVPVIGEYSAQLGLFSNRVLSLDAKWVPFATLCQRLDYWRPKFHVNVVWPKSHSTYVRFKLLKCDIVKRIKEKARYPVFADWQDELVLTRIYYKDN